MKIGFHRSQLTPVYTQTFSYHILLTSTLPGWSWRSRVWSKNWRANTKRSIRSSRMEWLMVWPGSSILSGFVRARFRNHLSTLTPINLRLEKKLSEHFKNAQKTSWPYDFVNLKLSIVLSSFPNNKGYGSCGIGRTHEAWSNFPQVSFLGPSIVLSWQATLPKGSCSTSSQQAFGKVQGQGQGQSEGKGRANLAQKAAEEKQVSSVGCWVSLVYWLPRICSAGQRWNESSW